jgi:tRNA uridine 5-carbamoylmethylation protein Kti12
MGELVKIKQVENLQTELDKIATVEQLAKDAGELAAAAKLEAAAAASAKNSSRVKETIKGIVSHANTKIQLQLSGTIANDQDVQVFVNGVLISKLTAELGTDIVEFSVPYSIDATDSVIIYYST